MPYLSGALPAYSQPLVVNVVTTFNFLSNSNFTISDAHNNNNVVNNSQVSTIQSNFLVWDYFKLDHLNYPPSGSGFQLWV